MLSILYFLENTIFRPKNCNFIKPFPAFAFRGETHISRHCVRRPHLWLVERKVKLPMGSLHFTTTTTSPLKRGRGSLRKRKLECLDKVCVERRKPFVWEKRKKLAERERFRAIGWTSQFPFHYVPHREERDERTKGSLDVDVLLADPFYRKKASKEI